MAENSNEKTAISFLLQTLVLEGGIATTDASGAQADIAPPPPPRLNQAIALAWRR